MAHIDNNAKSNNRAALRVRAVFSLFSHSGTLAFPWAWGNRDPKSLPRKLIDEYFSSISRGKALAKGCETLYSFRNSLNGL